MKFVTLTPSASLRFLNVAVLALSRSSENTPPLMTVRRGLLKADLAECVGEQ
jgi:hypothetical protein